VVGPPGLGTWTPGTPPIPGGSASNTNRMLASVRHVPFLIWAGTADQLVPVAGVEAQVATLDELGFRYTYDLFTLDHLSLAANDEYAPAADFLGTHRVVRNPAHVSYVVNPTMDSPGLGVVGDHAYWLSGLKLRRKSGPDPLGRVEATSGRLRTGDGAPEPTTETSGTLAGGNLGPLAYAQSEKDWGPEPTTKRRNRLDLDLDNLKRLIVHVKRAKLGCRPRMRVESDGPVAVKLAGCGRTLRFR
jgi:hypothetical protein